MRRPSLVTWSRYLGAAGVLAVGLDHLVQLSLDHYSAIPTIGPLFTLNAASALLIAGALVAPVERLPGVAGRAALPMLSLSGVAVAAGSLAGLLVSEQRPLFGFEETGYRPAIVVAMVCDLAAIAALLVHLTALLAARRGAPARRGLALPAGLVVAAVAATVAIAAGGGPASGAASASSGRPVTVSARHTAVGTALVDAHGRTLYLFARDRGAASACYGPCASLWPPLTARGEVAAGTGAVAAEIGTAPRTDGTRIVTYAGHPLYTYAGDARPGDLLGQGLDQFGAAWYALAPSGRQISARRLR